MSVPFPRTQGVSISAVRSTKRAAVPLKDESNKKRKTEANVIDQVKVVKKVNFSIPLFQPGGSVLATITAIAHRRLTVHIPYNFELIIHFNEAVTSDLIDTKDSFGLTDVYSVGQMVVCRIIPNMQGSRHIKVGSLLPSIVNVDMAWPPVRNQMMPVMVTSIEEHGFYADVQIPQARGFKCFVKTDDIPRDTGLIRYAVVDAVKKEAKLVACRDFKDSLGRFVSASSDLDLQGLTAGQLVEGYVREMVMYDAAGNSSDLLHPDKQSFKALKDPLRSYCAYPTRCMEINFGGSLSGIVTNPHLHQPHITCPCDPPKGYLTHYPFRASEDTTRTSSDIPADTFPHRAPEFKTGEKCLARIIAVVPSDKEEGGKRVILSLLPHLVYTCGVNSLASSMPTELLGSTLTDTRVFFNKKELGVKVFACLDPSISTKKSSKLDQWGVTEKSICVDILTENVADEDCEVEIFKLQAGQKLIVRLMSLNMIDGRLLGGCSPKILSEKYVHLSEIKIGDDIECLVKKVSDNFIHFQASKYVMVHAAVEQLTESASKLVDAKKMLKIDSQHNLRVLDVDNATGFIKVTNKKSLLKVSRQDIDRYIKQELELNDIVVGYVGSHHATGILVCTFGGPLGFLPYEDIYATTNHVTDTSKLKLDEQQTKLIQKNRLYQLGHSIKVRVQNIMPSNRNGIKKAIVFSVDLDKQSSRTVSKQSSAIPSIEDRLRVGCELPFAVDPSNVPEIVEKCLELLPKGTEITGVVRHKNDSHSLVYVSVWGRLRVCVHAMEFSDDLKGFPMRDIRIGEEVNVVIIGPAVRPEVHKNYLQILEGSLRDVDSPPLPRELSDLDMAKTYTGIVDGSGKAGLFVKLSSSLCIRIHWDQLGSDKKVLEARAKQTLADTLCDIFPVGKVIKNIRIVQIDLAKNFAHGSLVDLKMEAALMGITDLKDLITFEAVQVGNKLPAKFIKEVAGGILVSFVNSIRLNAFCLTNEITDEDTEIPTFEQGDLVLVKVIEKDETRRRIKVSMKPSHFDDLDIAAASEKVNQPSDSDAETDIADDDNISTSPSPAPTDMPCNEANDDDAMGDHEIPLYDDDSNTDFTESDHEVDLTLTSRDWLNAEAEEEENKFTKKVKSLTAKQTTKMEVADDYEKQMTISPDDPAVYIKYMAHLVQLSNLEKARQVAHTGIHTIDLERSKERQSIWFALLNMENRFGDSQSLLKALNEALQYNDPKIIYLHMIDVLESAGKWTELDALCEKMISKCSQSVDCWIRLLTSLYVRDTKKLEIDTFATTKKHKLSTRLQIDEMTKKAYHRVPADRHLELDLSLARLEYKFGSVENGRSKFLRVLNSKPKRNDIWNLFFDAQMALLRRSPKPDFVVAARDSFTQAATVDFKPTKMKGVFTRWLAFEKQYGSKETIKACQKHAVSVHTHVQTHFFR